MPSFKQVGHCKAASFSQSIPRHVFFAGGSVMVMMMVGSHGSPVLGGVVDEKIELMTVLFQVV